MADPELVKVLDYILNRSDEASIEAVAAAVVRRKRDLSLFGSAGIPDPKQFAHSIATRLGSGAELKGIQNTVMDMACEILRKEAPELTDGQMRELMESWAPSLSENAKKESLPADVLGSMIAQFIAYSDGTMDQNEERSLREQLGSWPERYWQAFPPVIRSYITEYLNGELTEKEFKARLRASLNSSSV